MPSRGELDLLLSPQYGARRFEVTWPPTEAWEGDLAALYARFSPPLAVATVSAAGRLAILVVFHYAFIPTYRYLERPLGAWAERMLLPLPLSHGSGALAFGGSHALLHYVSLVEARSGGCL